MRRLAGAYISSERANECLYGRLGQVWGAVSPCPNPPCTPAPGARVGASIRDRRRQRFRVRLRRDTADARSQLLLGIFWET
jgi:hypothetical protein